MTFEALARRLIGAATVFSRALAVIGTGGVILISAVEVRPPLAADDTCWPRNLTFPAGSQEDVAKMAADFLIKVEDVPQHPYWPQSTSGVTLGVGWDAGYHSRTELRETWAALGADTLA